MKKPLQQTSGHLRVGDLIRVLDKGMLGEIAICVESDNHGEYPYACIQLTGKDQDPEPVWPAKWIRLGNVVENVALLEREYLRLREVMQGMDAVRNEQLAVPIVFTSIGKNRKK